VENIANPLVQFIIGQCAPKCGLLIFHNGNWLLLRTSNSNAGPGGGIGLGHHRRHSLLLLAIFTTLMLFRRPFQYPVKMGRFLQQILVNSIAGKSTSRRIILGSKCEL
jgi:hypothetical protein